MVAGPVVQSISIGCLNKTDNYDGKDVLVALLFVDRVVRSEVPSEQTGGVAGALSP